MPTSNLPTSRLSCRGRKASRLRRLAHAVVLLLAQAPVTAALAQSASRTSPPNTVFGGLGNGPAQPIPFVNFGSGSAAGQMAWLGTVGASAVGSNVVTIGPGVPGSLAPFHNNLNVYPINQDNGIQLAYGTGDNAGLGGSITFYTKNRGGAAAHFNQELGFVQAYAWNGVAYNFAGAPLAINLATTEAWTPTANGAGVVFQIISRGETSARGELSIAEGVTAMAPGTTSIVTGMGVGTVNGESGVYDGGKRVLSAGNLGVAINQDSATQLAIANNSTGKSASAGFISTNLNGSTTFGTAGSANAGFSGLVTNKGVMHTQSTLDGLVLHADGASHPIQLITDGTERARALLGFMVGTTADPGAGIINVATGLRIGNAATSGNVLRGNGADFVSSPLAVGDLSDSAWTTFTPAITSEFGAARAVSATGRYKIVGKTVIVAHDITITHAGTAGGYVRASLPVTAASNKYVGNCVEAASTGKSGASAIIPAIGTGGIITREASARSWWVSGYEVACTTTYEIP